MPLSLMLWALFAVPLWALLLVPLAGAGAENGGFALGVAIVTLAAFVADRRLGAPGPARRVWPDRPRWLLFGLVAGLGMTVLASDVGNVGTHLAGVGVRAPEPPSDPPMAALNAAAFHVGLLLVVVGVAQRTLLALHRPWTAIALAALLGALPTPLYLWPQWGLLVGLPAWLFRHTRSLALALSAYAPTVILPVLDLFGVTPGVPGFDLVEPDAHVFQPVWFDLLGAALVALGVAPLLRDFDREARALEEPGEPDRSDEERGADR